MAFEIVDNQLSVVQPGGAVTIDQVAQRSSGPFYVYDLDGIVDRLNRFRNSFHRDMSIHYALKANDNPEILTQFAQQGVGVDVVSGGEIKLAMAAGFSPEKIVFSGVGKTVEELELAVQSRIKQINIESPQELGRIIDVAKRLGRKAKVAFRMNPDVEAETHPYITTGFRENKFGMDRSFLPQLEHLLEGGREHVELVGLTLHIGSQLRNITPVIEAIHKTIEIHNELKAKGWNLTTFDVGGGLGMSYEDGDLVKDEAAIEEYGRRVSEATAELDAEVLCEPGRILVGRFGLLVGEVQYIKESPYKSFAILNTGMHHIMRPSLYQAYHRIIPVTKKSLAPQLYDVVGPICESSDVLGTERALPLLAQGDLLAVADVGAYGYVMASTYNSHQMPTEYIVTQGKCQKTVREVGFC